MVNDEAPRVRLEAVRALSFVPTAAAAEIAVDVLAKPMDYYLQYVARRDDDNARAGLEAAAHHAARRSPSDNRPASRSCSNA